MKYMVFVSDKKNIVSDEDFYNVLKFNFDTLEGAITFSKRILEISKYNIEIKTYEA